jgi:hypothetical protein
MGKRAWCDQNVHATWYRFWVRDGAVADYHRSGVGSFNGFLL